MDGAGNGAPVVNDGRKRLLDREFVTSAISRSAENREDRRRFMRTAALLGTGVASAATSKKESKEDGEAGGISDSAILNFALNLEYLEANFYSFAVHGIAIPGSLMSGTGTQGGISGGRQVPFCAYNTVGYREQARAQLDAMEPERRRARREGRAYEPKPDHAPGQLYPPEKPML